MSPRPRVTILMLTYGEPPEPAFGEQYRYSLSILRRLTRRVAPIPRFLLPLIAFRRARGRVRTWREEAYRSPLESITREQAQALAAKLAADDPARAYEVRPVYEFRPPLLPEVLHGLRHDPPDRLFLLPMYLSDSDFTTGISVTDLETYVRRYGPFQPEPRRIGQFSEDDALAELMGRFVLEQLRAAGWSEGDMKAAGLLLGVHGTLVNGPPGIDTGYGTTQAFYQRLAERLAPRFASAEVGWMNHRVGGEWTKPELEESAAEMAKRGLRRVVYFPFGFLADNAETELEGRTVLRQQPDLEVTHLPCLNAWPPFIDYLAARVRTALA